MPPVRPHVMPLVGVGTFYLAAGGHSSWLFAWPISEQLSLGVSMDKICDYLAKFTLPNMLAFVKRGVHMVLTARRLAWVPYSYNVAIVSLSTELEDAGADSHAHILAMPMLSDVMAGRDLSPGAWRWSRSSSRACPPCASSLIRARMGSGRSTAPSTYEQWLPNVAGKDEDDAQEDSQREGDAAKSVRSTGCSPPMSDK